MKIICIGDSNTQGMDPRSFLGEDYEYPWPKVLSQLLGCEVINAGQNGIGTNIDFSYVDSLLEKEDFIVLMLGTNDVLRKVKREVIEMRLDSILDHYKEKFVILVCPLDINDISLLDVYQQLGIKYSFHVLDANTWNIKLSYDGIHFSQEGHFQFAQALYPYVVSL